MGTSASICEALKHPVTKDMTASHITEKAATERSRLDVNCVQTIRFDSTVDPTKDENEVFMDAPNNFPNCRTIIWRPNVKNAPRQGDYVESIFFSLQGMDNLYMRLYPHGKERSKAGYCSVYVGSCGTDKDVMLRVRIGGHSHIIAQKLSGDYVDGFVNFCPASNEENFEVSIEVLHGPRDEHLEAMDVRVPPMGNIAEWSIPRMTRSTIDSFSMGDRITSDTFTLPGMGDESCFVIYPKGDTVDAISSVGNFVNVGLFGSSDQDVTFRLSAGTVSKVLTACCDRYKTKDIGKTKSCGEFFDACFATIDELVDFKTARLEMKLEVLDTVSRHTMTTFEGKTTWEILGCDQMLNLLIPGEKLYSRYVHLPTLPGVFMNYAISYDKVLRELNFEVFCINGARDTVTMDIDFKFQFGCDLNATTGYDVGKTQEYKEIRAATFKGLKDSLVFKFNQDKQIPFRMFHAEVTTHNVALASMQTPMSCLGSTPNSARLSQSMMSVEM